MFEVYVCKCRVAAGICCISTGGLCWQDYISRHWRMLVGVSPTLFLFHFPSRSAGVGAAGCCPVCNAAQHWKKCRLRNPKLEIERTAFVPGLCLLPLARREIQVLLVKYILKGFNFIFMSISCNWYFLIYVKSLLVTSF